jgi:hypothetical protein
MWSSFVGSAPPPDTTGGVVGIIENSTRYRWSAGTSQRPDQSRGRGWGRGCGLPAEACPGYALHNLCYTKLILALFKASVKFHGRILYEVPSFPICAFSRILEQFSQRNAPGGFFPSRQCIHVNTLLQPWVLSPTPESDLSLVGLCRIRRGSCSLAVGFWGWVVLVCVDLSLCEEIYQKERGSGPPSPIQKPMQT